MVNLMTERDGPVFDPRGAKLVYVQIADDIADRITRGIYAERIPSLGEITDEYGCARMTARRAVRELRDRGLVEIVPGKGTFVITR